VAIAGTAGASAAVVLVKVVRRAEYWTSGLVDRGADVVIRKLRAGSATVGSAVDIEDVVSTESDSPVGLDSSFDMAFGVTVAVGSAGAEVLDATDGSLVVSGNTGGADDGSVAVLVDVLLPVFV
jgi:hypothetical protein